MTGARRQSRTRSLQLFAVFLLLFLLIFLLGTESARAMRTVGRETVREETLTRTLSASGYLFREETAVSDLNSGPVRYLKADGEHIHAGEALAQVYRDDTGTDKRARAASLSAELELLERALTEDSETWQRTYLRALEALTVRSSRGEAGVQESAARVMSVALLRKEAESVGNAALEARIATLQTELAALVQYVGEPDTVLSAGDGTFYRETDGYEQSFSPAAAEGLTPEGLRQLLREGQVPQSQAPLAVGKVVSCTGLVLAVPVAADEALFFLTGESYTVTLEGAAEAIGMTLTAKNPSATGEEILLLLSAGEAPVLPDAARCRRVQIAGESVTGLSVPETAMRVEGNRDGVYILENGVATWRPVKILYRADGCCLVAPGHPAESAATTPELAVGDTLIVTARRIYEGKAVSG